MSSLLRRVLILVLLRDLLACLCCLRSEFFLWFLCAVLTAGQAQALSEASKGLGTRLEAAVQGVEGICLAYGVRFGAFYKLEAKCQDLDEALCILPTIHRPVRSPGHAGRISASLYYVIF